MRASTIAGVHYAPTSPPALDAPGVRTAPVSSQDPLDFRGSFAIQVSPKKLFSAENSEEILKKILKFE